MVRAFHSWCDGSSDRSFMMDPLRYFLFQPVLHEWCNKGCGMCYPVCGMMHIKEPLLLIGKSSLCGGSGFPFSLSEWSLTICLTSYNCIYKNVLSVSLNKTFPSFLPSCTYHSRLLLELLRRTRGAEMENFSLACRISTN